MSMAVVYDADQAGSSYTSSYDADVFYVNVDNIDRLTERLGLCADSLNNTINGLIAKTEGMSEGWEGDDYTAYKESIYRYAPYLRTFIFFIQAYNVLLTNLSVNASTLYLAVKANLEK